VKREHSLHQQEQQHEAGMRRRQASRPWVYIAGIVGFLIMSVQGLVSTLNPKPDGRLLNTAPSLGFDIFLFIGLLGIGFCVVQLIRGR
jgi:hypothetical protein